MTKPFDGHIVEPPQFVTSLDEKLIFPEPRLSSLPLTKGTKIQSILERHYPLEKNRWKCADNNIFFAINDGQGRGGTYVLRIRVLDPTSLVFGGFKRGKSIDVLAGDYIYVGSAMSDSGSTCLARRLLRHATRTSGQGHLIRQSMLRVFPEMGIADEGIQPPIGKKFKWNVDYILDLPIAELISVYVLRSDLRLEPIVGNFLETDPATSIIEKGLGANDRPGSTYLLRGDADEAWWSELASRLERTLIANENAHLARS